MTLDDELRVTARIERSRLEIHFLMTRSRIEYELERTKIVIKVSNKRQFKGIHDKLKLKRSDQLNIDIKSAITDDDELLLP
ncbi:MAG: hypothetical protein F4X56_01185 [Gammaproteobacteria bacterium]|nr:hypothetical protein [Gammaproteobacteria bacterium]